MNVSDASTWIHSLRRFGIKPGLDRMKRILAALGNPESSLRFYHVAGTNGKGSVCAMLDAMLRSSGRRTGLFTSPGFGGLTGRMTVDGASISETAFASSVARVKRTVEEEMAEDPLTEFEVLTVVALLHFSETSVDTVVWETGLGGRYDSTNVVLPAVTAITNVSLDHVAVLGPTIAHIAREKAGIVKPGIPVVTGADATAYRVIEGMALAVGAPILRVGRDIEFTEMRRHMMGSQIRGYYRGLYGDRGNIELSLFGRHQLMNAAVALAMFEIGENGGSASATALPLNALRDVKWPMRFEVFGIRDDTPIIVDGAHNAGAANVLAQALEDFSRRHQLSGQWDMVIGLLSDKDASEMLRYLLPYARRVLICEPHHIRALKAEHLAEEVRKLKANVPLEVISNVEQATEIAMNGCNPVVIWGSLYMVEDARKTIAKMGIDYWTRGR